MDGKNCGARNWIYCFTFTEESGARLRSINHSERSFLVQGRNFLYSLR